MKNYQSLIFTTRNNWCLDFPSKKNKLFSFGTLSFNLLLKIPGWAVLRSRRHCSQSKAENACLRRSLCLSLQYFDSTLCSVQMSSLQFVIVQDSTILTGLESLTPTFCPPNQKRNVKFIQKSSTLYILLSIQQNVS